MKSPMNTEGICKNDWPALRDAVAETAAAVIRERSAKAELISESEILGLLKDKRIPFPDTDKADEEMAEILTQLVHDNDDLDRLYGAGANYYYSSSYMTDAYVKILLYKLEGPMQLIAETVRHNSHIYQRPVPLDIFTGPPFNLTQDQVLDTLAITAVTEGYNDIAKTSTSSSAVYLYSTSCLETEQAIMLAEWLDVGQSNSP